MQITIDLDKQHIQRLHEQEGKLKKSISELVTLAIDEAFPKKIEQTEGEKSYQLMLQSGFIGCVENHENLSENYKEYLDWSHKI